MAGLRYQNIGPFFSGRRMKLAGVSYEPGDPIDTDIVVGLKHLERCCRTGTSSRRVARSRRRAARCITFRWGFVRTSPVPS